MNIAFGVNHLIFIQVEDERVGGNIGCGVCVGKGEGEKRKGMNKT